MNNIFSSDIRRHDQFQFETVFTYPFETAWTEKYCIDVYFFLPDNLGVNAQTCDSELFYRSLQQYMRLKTPQMQLKKVFSGLDSPLRQIDIIIKLLPEKYSEADCRDYFNRVKTFCSIVKSAIRDESQVLVEGDFNREFLARLKHHQKLVSNVIHCFREVHKALRDKHCPESVYEFFRCADEFLSLTVNRYRWQLWRELDQIPETSITEKAKTLLHAGIEEEIEYRKKCGYPAIQKAHSDNSEYVYREGTLKKLMASVLFLKTSKRKDGILFENLICVLVAGVAMAFATGVAMAWQWRTPENVSIDFFVILVAAYMMKDRIKEIGRNYFQMKLKSIIFDYKTEITNNFGKIIGICKESAGWIDEQKVSVDIISKRQRNILGWLENRGYPEQILRYRKFIRIRSKVKRDELLSDFEVNGIVDIMRFNIEPFLKHMDDEDKEIMLPDVAPRIRTVNAKRLYHVNIIMKYSIPNQPALLRKIRLVLSKNGIYQIEHFD